MSNRSRLPFSEGWSPEFQKRLNDALEERFRVLNEYALVPYGGTQGQALVKKSDRPYELEWAGTTAEAITLAVRNSTGSTITRGSAVYINGAQGANLPTIALAQANALATSRAIGLVQNDIANNSNGSVVVLGPVTNLNTSGFTAGAALYVSPTVAGGLTSTRPTGATDYIHVVGYVTISNVAVGEIKVIPSALSLPAGAAATDHGALTGLADDDHTQYYNQTRGDARYLQLSGGTLTGALQTAAAGIELGHASDTTITRLGAGRAAIEGVEIGYRQIPLVSTTGGTAATTEVGKCYSTTGGITIPNSTFAAGDTFSIYNNSGSSITITASITTLRLAGTATTGNRTLAQRGMCTVWFISGTEAVIMGSGLT